ncbi:MAG: hypothetical protein A2175_00935 [Candidatus Nealsonbacteria bacterium RBG_13_42_11]|uniref:Uncharacterized protein n=1 Tax=Candidatus Nealsonbacteria bacterium RBG_13_42_11 TaxID=1801663 RepID=A0A1G2DZ15_9BACT|nr:MAG: hypothetical protein A2175_00935 [Candidatus Nealsonbacteria bacterium RBG_13_42_11]
MKEMPWEKITLGDVKKLSMVGVAAEVDGDKKAVRIHKPKSSPVIYAIGPEGEVISLETLSLERRQEIVEESKKHRLDQGWC